MIYSVKLSAVCSVITANVTGAMGSTDRWPLIARCMLRQLNSAAFTCQLACATQKIIWHHSLQFCKYQITSEYSLTWMKDIKIHLKINTLSSILFNTLLWWKLFWTIRHITRIRSIKSEGFMLYFFPIHSQQSQKPKFISPEWWCPVTIGTSPCSCTISAYPFFLGICISFRHVWLSTP